MQRPVMNPTFFEESSPHSGQKRLLRLLGHSIWRVVRLGLRFLTYDPFHSIAGFRVEEGSPTVRIIRGIMYRLAFVPVFIALAACAIVWVSTHPRSVTVPIDPASQGIYYEPVTFTAPDQTKIDAWLVPQMSAKTVLEEKDRALRRKYPVVVLVHDMGQRREQMLPLIKPLHEAGYVVLALNLRGGGLRATTGETYGLTEAGDLKAAVDMLRRRVFVDAKRIALVGCGTGATAALLAADADPQIAAVVADHPVRGPQDLVETRMVPRHRMLRWMSPLCKWTFELAYGVDVEEVAVTNFKKLFQTRPVLMIDPASGIADPADPRTAEQVISFLSWAAPGSGAVAEVK